MSILHLTNADFDETVAQGRCLVDFWAGWCAPCRMLAPTIEALAGKYDGSVKVCKVDIDNEPLLASRFEVMSIPTVVFIENGVEKGRVVGVQPQAAIEALLG